MRYYGGQMAVAAQRSSKMCFQEPMVAVHVLGNLVALTPLLHDFLTHLAVDTGYFELRRRYRDASQHRFFDVLTRIRVLPTKQRWIHSIYPLLFQIIIQILDCNNTQVVGT